MGRVVVGRPKIMIIDDDAVSASIVSSTLEVDGLATACFRNGEEGLEHIAEEQPCAILLDCMRLAFDGNQILERLKNDPETRDIPVIMLSARNGIDDISTSLALGADDYIVKPFNQDNLVERLHNVIEQSGVLSRDMNPPAQALATLE